MPFSILITTSMKVEGQKAYEQSEHVAAALNTLVQEFPTYGEAEVAVTNINKYRGVNVSQYAIRLYKEL